MNKNLQYMKKKKIHLFRNGQIINDNSSLTQFFLVNINSTWIMFILIYDSVIKYVEKNHRWFEDKVFFSTRPPPIIGTISNEASEWADGPTRTWQDTNSNRVTRKGNAKQQAVKSALFFTLTLYSAAGKGKRDGDGDVEERK